MATIRFHLTGDKHESTVMVMKDGPPGEYQFVCPSCHASLCGPSGSGIAREAYCYGDCAALITVRSDAD